MPGYNSGGFKTKGSFVEQVKMALHLVRNEGFVWEELTTESVTVWAKGFVFDAENILRDGKDLCQYFARAQNEPDFVTLLLQANGSFAVIVHVHNSEMMLAAVDRLRSMPLFYTSGDVASLAGDDADVLAQIIGVSQPDETSLHEFALAGFVLGRDTLHPEIKEIQAGEYIRFDPSGPIPVRYYCHLHTSDNCTTEEEYFASLIDISQRMAQRLIRSVHDRPILLPLSGGYDSRYVACMLKDMKFERVECYTYGRSDSHEVATSRRVAAALGYKWHFVEYTAAKIAATLGDPHWDAYCHYCHNRSSLPHIQEFIALTELQSMGKLPDDTVIVPGFCGDLLGGSYVPVEFQIGNVDALLSRGLAEHIADKHLYIKLFTDDFVTTKVRTHIQQVLDEMGAAPYTRDAFVSYNEAFFTAHKVAKFVVNSLRVYEFFGYAWRMPLWDQELIDYWYRVPTTERINGRLYNRFLFSHYFEPMKVAIHKTPNANIDVKVRRLLHQLSIPDTLTRTALSTAHRWRTELRRPKPHFNAFDEFERYYVAQLHATGMPRIYVHNVNGVFARWWLWRKYGWTPALRPINDSDE